MILRLFLTSLLLATVALSAEETQTKPPETPAARTQPEADHPETLRELIDTLNQANLQEAFRLLKTDYINHDQLDYLEINRAALQGLLDRLDFGALLLTEESRSASNSPFGFYKEQLTPTLAYLRFGKYNQSGVTEMDAALTEFTADKRIETLIVDLRSPQAQADFSIAAEILSRFRPPNELLFKIRRPGNDRATLFVSKPKDVSWRRNLVLLVDGETGNVGEIIAAVLKRESKCLVVGEATPGLTVEYRDVPIGEDRILRYAIAEVVLEDNSSLFQKGVVPDLVTVTQPQKKKSIYRKSENGESLKTFLFLDQRPRLNEAALVAGTDPEMDYYLLRSAEKPTRWDKPILQDRVLTQAVDLLETVAYLEKE